jgi:hypothetical protein
MLLSKLRTAGSMNTPPLTAMGDMFGINDRTLVSAVLVQKNVTEYIEQRPR